MKDELFGPSGLVLLKLGRLVRVLRALRLFGQMRILWQLVHGLISSMTTISSFMLFLFVVFYVFACSGVELITKYGGWSAEAQRAQMHLLSYTYLSTCLSLTFP